MKLLKKTETLLMKIEAFAMILLICAIFVVMILQIIKRYFLNDPLNWSEEFCRYSFVYLAYIGTAYCVSLGSHTTIDLLYEKMPPIVQKIMIVVGSLVVAGVLIYMVPPTWKYAMKQMMMKSSTMRMPMGFLYLCLPINFILISVQTILHLVLINIKEAE